MLMDTTLNHRSFELSDVPAFKEKMLNWLKPFGIFCYLDNQQYAFAPQQEECLAAAGVKEAVEGDDIKSADGFFAKKQWAFGHLGYELKNSLHRPAPAKKDKIGFPPFYFFSPQIVLEIKSGQLHIHAREPQKIFDDVCGQVLRNEDVCTPSIEPQAVMSKAEYLERIRSLQAHILRGDCYEINFCQEFFATGATIDPFIIFQKLMAVSPNPFSAFYRLHDKFLLCASPERFLLKRGKKLVAQPIKGTNGRNLSSPAEDEALKNALRQSRKDQAENVMIVDLVRNDLTRICNEASITVEELFGVYTFPQVHQMISTISGELRDDVSFAEIIGAAFPMGSMTGAPKHRVLQLIDEYEPSARGIFSGSVGYVRPDGDFDFNVVIRSLMYNAAQAYLSYQVGSGITFYSDPEGEWEECMLKAEAIRKVLRT